MCIIISPATANSIIFQMKLSQDYSPGTNVIHSYADGKIQVNNQLFSRSLLISNTLLIADWNITDVEQMSHADWQAILAHQPEVILIGTGESLIFPHPSNYAPAIEQGIGVEFMDSGAACRTYNILLSEDRFVIAGIIL